MVVRFGNEPEFLPRFGVPGRALRLQEFAERLLALPAIITFRRINIVNALLDPGSHDFAIYPPRSAHRQPRHLDARSPQCGKRHFRSDRLPFYAGFFLRQRVRRDACGQQARRANRRRRASAVPAATDRFAPHQNSSRQ